MLHSLVRRVRRTVFRRLCEPRVQAGAEASSGEAGCERPGCRGLELLHRRLRALAEHNDELRRRHRDLEEVVSRLREAAATDPLTRLPNRRAFEEALEKAASHAARRGEPLSLLLVDVDRFKRINDEFGHPAGDQVLAGVAGVLRRACRKVDTPARYGGEEFAVVLPWADARVARMVGERIRRAVEAADWPNLAVTVSLGAHTAYEAADADGLVREADRALYASKRGGRNRFTHALEVATPHATSSPSRETA